MAELDYKKYFLRSMVIALAISALIGITIFLSGDFGDTQLRLLVTTLTMTGYSLTGLCCSVIYRRGNWQNLSIIGIGVSILGFLFTIAAIWEAINPDNEAVWKGVLIFIIVAFTLAHISLIALVHPKTKSIRLAMALTLAFIGIVALMLIFLTANPEIITSDGFYRLLGVFAILDVLGTISTPIMNKITE